MTRVLVVADSIIMRAGLETVIGAGRDRSSDDGLEGRLEESQETGASRNLQVVGSTALGNHLTQQIDALQPDVVLMEISGTEDVIALLSPLEADPPQLAIALLIDELQPSWLSESLRLGVRSVLPVEASAAELVAAIEAAALGLLTLHPDFVEGLLSPLPSSRNLSESSLQRRSEVSSQLLTPREIEVLQMLAEGLGNKAIARRLQISEHTVKFHIGSLFTKLHASSRTEAVMLGARQGFILI